MEKTENSKETPEFLKERRRMFDRFPSRFPVKFKDTRQEFGERVNLRNVSAEGARITTKERVYLNDSISLEVKLTDGKEPMTMRGEVIWTKEKDANMWDVGIKFYNVVFMDMWRIFKAIEMSSAS